MASRIFFLFLIFGFTQLRAQTFTGKVTDEVTGDGIPFVSIGILGTNQATVSNENGDFVLKADLFPAKIRCSHVSYAPTEITLTKFQDKVLIKLKSATFSLSTVVIDPYLGQRIVKKALDNALANVDVNFYGNAFYRQLTSVNNQPSQIYELFYDLELNPRRIQGWSAKQSRFAELSQQFSFAMNNQSYVTFSYSGYLYPDKGGKFVTVKNFKDYNIEVQKYIAQEDQQIAVISCKYKGSKKKDYYVNSVFYIGMSDNKVYRVENSSFNLPMRFTNATSTFPIIFTTVATFSATEKPVSALESISTKLYLTVDVDGRKISSAISSLLTIYRLDSGLKNQTFNSLNRETKDKKVMESVTYNPDFWKNNPVVKQTSLEDSFIKMMENKSAFGTMTNP